MTTEYKCVSISVDTNRLVCTHVVSVCLTRAASLLEVVVALLAAVTLVTGDTRDALALSLLVTRH